MYLTLLKEDQKKLFLSLARTAALADGEYSDEENTIISSYCKEMQITFDQANTEKPVNEIIAEINISCGAGEKKIIVFEIIGLMMVDNDYSKSERGIVERMASTFGLESGFAKECESLLEEYITLQTKINRLVVE